MRKVLVILLLSISGLVQTVFAGDWGKSFNVTKGAGFISLARGAKSYEGHVKDESSKYHLKDVCFGGITKIGGIRKEGDDSSTEINMEGVQEISVISGRFKTIDPRHSQALEHPLFVKAKVTFKSGSSEELLFPYDIVISGVDIKTESGKAWYLRDINRVTVAGEYVTKAKKKLMKKVAKEAKKEEAAWWKKIVSW
jgi:hypothetical protein